MKAMILLVMVSYAISFGMVVAGGLGWLDGKNEQNRAMEMGCLKDLLFGFGMFLLSFTFDILVL